MVVRVSVVLRRTVWDDIDWRFNNLGRSHRQSQVNCESKYFLLYSPRLSQLPVSLLTKEGEIKSWSLKLEAQERYNAFPGYKKLPLTQTQKGSIMGVSITPLLNSVLISKGEFRCWSVEFGCNNGIQHMKMFIYSHNLPASPRLTLLSDVRNNMLIFQGVVLVNLVGKTTICNSF